MLPSKALSNLETPIFLRSATLFVIKSEAICLKNPAGSAPSTLSDKLPTP